MRRSQRQHTPKSSGNASPARGDSPAPSRAGWASAQTLSSWVSWGLYPVALLAILWFLTIRPIADPDCWFHMALGRYVVEHGQIPKTDLFSHTAVGREWISSGWLASVLMHLLFSRFGPAGLVGMVFTVLAVCWVGIYLLGVRRARSGHTMILVLIAAALAAYLRFNPRPDLWSIFFTPAVALLLLVGDYAASSPRRAVLAGLALPCVMLLWANLHAGFLAGLILIAIAALFRWRAWWAYSTPARYVWLSGIFLSFLAWIANPYGVRVLALAAKIRAIPGVRMLIFEWMPMVYLPGFNLPMAAYVGFGALVALGTYLMWRGRQTDKQSARDWHVVAALFLVLFALWQRRQAGLCAAALPVLLLPYLPSLEARLRTWGAKVPALVVAATIFICSLQVKGVLEAGEGWPVAALNARMLPCAATEFLERFRPPEQLFNSYGFGGYFMYFLGPRLKVFLDGRLDVYAPQTWLDYLAAEENRLTIEQVCARYGINTFAIEARDAFGDPVHLVNRLSQHPEWALMFYDDDSAIFVKRSAMSEEQRAQEIRYASPYQLQKFLQAVEDPQTQAAALTELRRVVEISNGCAYSYALAAWAAWRTGEQDAVSRYLAKAFERDPQCPLAKQLVEQMRAR
ncbi:MAG: hypothetical protein N2644_01060 [Candidatus Sumerlaea chitinivorans]|nr:hypothetical protein [Candidatus Sumerlaea chitinivorans]